MKGKKHDGQMRSPSASELCEFKVNYLPLRRDVLAGQVFRNRAMNFTHLVVRMCER